MSDTDTDADLLDRARAWAAEDPDPVTRAELEALIEGGDTTELADRFDGTLSSAPLVFVGLSAPGPTG